MSLNTLIKAGITALLGGPIIDILVDKASQKATAIFKEKFTFTAFEIAKTYQESYNYALAAITAGLAEPDEKVKFLQTLTHSKVEREFAAQIEPDYLQPFADLKGLSRPELRLQLIEQLQQLVQQPPIFTAENRRFTESELAAFIKDDGALAITDLILAQCSLDKTLEAFLRYDDLLGKATLFFFRELLHDDARAKTTLETLQRENLLVKVDALKTTQDKVLKRLQQQLNVQKNNTKQALDTGDFSQAHQMMEQMEHLQKAIDTVPQRLQTAVATWQNSHQPFLEFSHRFSTWAQLLDATLTEVLEQMGAIRGPILETNENVKTLLEEFRAFKQRFDLSTEVKPRDEFTHHTPSSSAQIQKALAKLKRLPVHNYQLSLLAGTVVSSTGEIAEAENLFIQARDCAQNKADKALASFNLFQVRLRRQAYPDALADLQSAIGLDPNYALHDIGRYPIKQLLGAGGMGGVFLCEDKLKKRLVAVKCFWEKRQGKYENVFKEAMMMDKIAGEYVPEPLNCGYVNAVQQEKPYFVTEYIEGALDGEAWIEKYGKLDVSTGLEVGIHIAKGLQLAHEHKIYHLDLKPANLLLKRTKTGIRVKIIDFGLARVGSSLRDSVLQGGATGKTQFGQMIIGTLYYAPPEQLGHGEYGEPSAQSDLYAFGASLYRLMSGEIPQPLNPECLTEAPPALFQLLCQCLNRIPEQRPDSAQQLVNRLEEIKAGLVEIPAVQPLIQMQSQQQSSQPKSFLKVFGGLVVVVVATLIWFNSEKNEPTQTITDVQQNGKVFQDRLKDGSLGPKMVWIPAGQFRMGDIQGDGSSDEKPVHEVSVDGFAMSQYEVTLGEFRQFVNATGYKTEAEKGDGCLSYKEGWDVLKEANWDNSYLSQNDNHPVVCVSWNDANAYVEWLSTQTGQKYRLPTEAEWEYAARAGTETKYWWGNEIGSNKANCSNYSCGDSFEYTAPVGSFEPNPFGLYDTAGNVWEWTCSEYSSSYDGSEKSCSASPNRLSLRGGSWDYDETWLRSAGRDGWSPASRDDGVGLRVARLP
jgi:formylglycine-generating enzyme required for sulfatase activity/tetratricopeptide (TPR) repeat protein